MIKTETISPKALRLTAPEKFRSDDFQKLALQVDPLIRQHNNIRLLIDASKFHGWEKISALKNHVGKMLHAALLFLMLEAVTTDLVSPSA